jgi:nitrite reductase (NADH) large subunit
MIRFGIIGNGVAAITAVREIRRRDKDVEIDVFTDERYGYYPRPKLIDFVAGRGDEKGIIQYDTKWYEKQGVILRKPSAVTKINANSLSLETFSSKYENYDKLLLAVGSHPFVPPIRGVEKKGIHVMRTLDDAIGIKEAVKGAEREIIIGGGILGIELAAAIMEVGGAPIVVTHIDTLLPAQLDASGSEVLLSLLKRKGIDILLGFRCMQMTGDEHIRGVKSTAGDSIKGDLVVIATGVRPNTELAKSSGIASNKGIIIDHNAQTSAPGIFAAGDCTEWDGVPLCIIPVALETAKVAAQNMLKLGSRTYRGIIPSNTLQVAGVDLTSVGFFNPQSPEYESIVVADQEAGTYFKAVIQNNRVVGGIALGNRKVAINLRRLVNQGTDVSEMHEEIFEPF